MSHPRLNFDRWPEAIYAVGDVHGCLEQLLELEAKIADDAIGIAGEKWLITLGDHIDRGPASAQVVAHMLAPPPPGFRRLCLLGNHEQVMLGFLREPAAFEYWLDEGGLETLASYGVEVEDLPPAHLQWMRELPVLITLPGWAFVHAGIRPGVPLEAQSEEDLVWIREPFLGAKLPLTHRIVHGHTPVLEPVVTPYRIGIDTQCYATGRLTALRVTPDGATKFLAVGG